MPARIKTLYAFDFDNTLAITPSIIGVRRTTPEGISDPTFEDWALDMGLDIEDIENEGTDNEIIWFDSGMFANYEAKHRRDLDYLESNGFEDEYDFSKTASVDLDATTGIESMVSLLQQAYGDPNSKVVIITARSGTGAIPSLSGGSVAATNVDDIQKFLQGQGVSLDASSVSTAGDAGGSPQAKVQALQSYIDQYDPELLYFYDDSAGNVDAVVGLCADLYPHLKIKAFKLDNAGNIQSVEGCYENLIRF